MKKRTLAITVLLLFIVFTISSCVPEGPTQKEYGFFSGFVHGIVFLFALVGKLFGADIGLYAQHNTGFFYWLGFIIGLAIIGGGGGAASRRRS